QRIEDALIATTRETPRRFLAIMGAEFAAQGFLVLELWTLLISLHVPCGLGRAALVEGVIKFINAGGFFVPAQIGVAEGGYAVIFGLFGLPAVAGVTLSIARHVRTLVIALIGMCALARLAGRASSRRCPIGGRGRQLASDRGRRVW